MKPVVRSGVLFLVAFAALMAGYFAFQRLFQPQPEQAGAALIDFSLPYLSGRERWISEWQGRPLVLNFWATWCGPCREEIPLLIKAQKRYRDRGAKIGGPQIVGIAIDDRASVAGFAKEMGINYPLLIAEEAG